ncbi:MAG: SRPBCC family protein [Acidimicrobiia bacterium]
MTTGSASVVINQNPATVFALITDVTRTGEWSPECLSGRWVGDAAGPAVGAKFEGDNALVIGGMTLKRWTTTSEVTEYVPGARFAFVAEEYTTWRYDLEPVGDGTRVTESFDFTTASSMQRFLYETVARRPASMVKGIQKTLDRMKAHLES